MSRNAEPQTVAIQWDTTFISLATDGGNHLSFLFFRSWSVCPKSRSGLNQRDSKSKSLSFSPRVTHYFLIITLYSHYSTRILNSRIHDPDPWSPILEAHSPQPKPYNTFKLNRGKAFSSAQVFPQSGDVSFLLVVVWSGTWVIYSPHRIKDQ